MRYMIDTREIPQDRPSNKQIALNKWKLNEMGLMGLMVPYDSENSSSGNTKLTQFKSQEEYAKAAKQALELLDSFKQVPEPLRKKLILEADNLRKQGKQSCLI